MVITNSSFLDSDRLTDLSLLTYLLYSTLIFRLRCEIRDPNRSIPRSPPPVSLLAKRSL